MNKILSIKKYVVALVVPLFTVGHVWAFDFSALSSSGHRLGMTGFSLGSYFFSSANQCLQACGDLVCHIVCFGVAAAAALNPVVIESRGSLLLRQVL